jgi:hypothetical protein
MRRRERFPYPRPPVRPLKIYAFDPMIGLDRRTRISVETRNEPLNEGPLGERISVVDYDSTFDCFYVPVDLDDPAILMQGGIDPSESDPRFHQQMVYAVASRVVEIFDRALGRPADLARTKDGKARPIRLFPHAFSAANAYYNPDLGAILFGYFRASEDAVGQNIPGQIIFSCLSHDVIAHELTHALIHQLSPKLLNSEHPDTQALHEGLADLVAILHRFSLESVVRDEVQRTRGKLDVNSDFCKVAPQFGAGLGMVHGLRNAREPADPKQYGTVLEPHSRGALLISAVLEALFECYRDAVKDLMEIATVSGVTDGSELHPDLVNRLATEVSRLARSLLTMCIRAFDYLPPVDVSFGDFLRSVVTADWELAPADYSHMRSGLIESFRRRGIYATGARSLAEESLIWERPAKKISPLPASIAAALTENAKLFGRIRPGEGERTLTDESAAQGLDIYAFQNAKALNLWPSNQGTTLNISGTRYCFRVGADGQLSIDIVVKFTQERRDGETVEYRGTTIVAAADGTVRYIISNQLLPRLERANDPNPTPALVQSSPAPPPMQQPFAKRYRLSAARYREKFPRLAPSDEDMNRFKDALGLGDLSDEH